MMLRVQLYEQRVLANCRVHGSNGGEKGGVSIVVLLLGHSSIIMTHMN